MRAPQFIAELQTKFDVSHDTPEKAKILANAMDAAIRQYRHTFMLGGVWYTIVAEWKHGCYRGDCNPAICFTNWSIEDA